MILCSWQLDSGHKKSSGALQFFSYSVIAVKWGILSFWKGSIVPSTDSLLMRLPYCSFSRNLCNLKNIIAIKYIRHHLSTNLYFQFENTCSSGSGFGEGFFGNSWFCPARVPLCLHLRSFICKNSFYNWWNLSVVQLFLNLWSSVSFGVITTVLLRGVHQNMADNFLIEIFHFGSTAEHLEVCTMRFWVLLQRI